MDELLDASKNDKVKQYATHYSVCVAYQCPITIQLSENGAKEEALSNTFEDALVFENLVTFKELEGDGLIKKFKELINREGVTSQSLGEGIFEILKEKGDKAKFALDLLYLRDPDTLKVPTYIDQGLHWLQSQLTKKQSEIVTIQPVIEGVAS